jgi:hypothetical protein
MFRPALVVGSLAIAMVADAAPRPGKVVRVERAAGRPMGTPRLCTVTGGDSSAYCFGKRPEVGDMLPVVDMHHVVATLRIAAVESSGLCGKNDGPFWSVKTTFDHGDQALATSDAMMFGLLDIPVDPRNAHIVKEDRPPVPADTVIAIDSTGDGEADFEFLQMKCDDSGSPTTSGSSFCIDVWYASGRHFERLRTDRFQPSCY